jgi:hypothetical protein
VSTASVRIIICHLFTATLDPAERIGECHLCGRQVRREAGILEADICVRLRCTECASGDVPPVWDPRAGDGCICAVPLPSQNWAGCMVCLGSLPAQGRATNAP